MYIKDKTTALLLSIFLGGLGIDRFYLGYTGLGILKLLTFGGLGVWWLIDIILIACGSLKEAPKVLLNTVVMNTMPASQNINVNVASGGNIKTTEAPASVADELAKYKALLDSGAITQEEFEQKKAELLNN